MLSAIGLFSKQVQFNASHCLQFLSWLLKTDDHMSGRRVFVSSRFCACIIISAVNCGSLPHQIANDIIEPIGYSQPAIVGTSVTFVCPSTHVQTGPNTTTCMRNGEWEPDPRLVECTGE